MQYCITIDIVKNQFFLVILYHHLDSKRNLTNLAILYHHLDSKGNLTNLAILYHHLDSKRNLIILVILYHHLDSIRKPTNCRKRIISWNLSACLTSLCKKSMKNTEGLSKRTKERLQKSVEKQCTHTHARTHTGAQIHKILCTYTSIYIHICTKHLKLQQSGDV